MTKRVLFNAYDTATNVELWITDGTAAGTFMLKDINPGTSPSDPAQFTAFRGKALFVANDGAHGSELWLTDGTSAGTALLKDIRSGSSGSSVAELTVFGDKVVFRATDGVNGSELWVTDGTPGGTTMLKDIAPGSLSSTPSWFKVLGDKLLFQANNGTSGAELWVSDGTSAGTMLLKDINPGSAGSAPDRFAVFGDKVLFGANDGVHGTELWVTDGTAAGTVLVKDISTGSSFPSGFTVLGDKVLFLGIDTLSGSELWVTDGTAAGTTMLKDLVPGAQGSGPVAFTRFGDKVLFSAGVSGLFDVELWITDGTAEGTVLLKDIYQGPGASFPAGFKVLGDKVVFQATTAAAGIEAWVTDGTPEGTMLLKDIAPGTANSYGGGGAILGDIALFQANDSVRGPELWMSDGTSAGTVIVKDLIAGQGSYPNALTTITFAESFLEGTAGDDALTGGGGDDAIYGRAGNDNLEGGDGADEIEGGAGDDVLDGGGADDLLDGGAGSDTLSGGAGNDRIIGGDGVDQLDGGTGNDRLSLGRVEGEEAAHGGEGVDFLNASFAAATAGLGSTLTANPLGGYDGWIGDGAGLRVTFSGIERFNLTGGAGGDALTGGALDDSLIGGAGSDELSGGGGADWLGGGTGDDVLTGGEGGDLLDGGSGADLMTGGAGDDTYRVDDSADSVDEAAGGGSDEVQTTLSAYALGANVERLTGTGSGQSLTGNGLDNLITGSAGNDVIDGGAGADRMIGGGGNDIFVVEDSGDLVEDSGGTDEVRVSVAVYSVAANPDLENLTGTSDSGQTLTGNDAVNVIKGAGGGDRLDGGGGNDQIFGGGGDDRMDGGAGLDTMTGGAGNDVYVVDSPSDVVVEAADGGVDEILIGEAGYYIMAANVENATVVGSAWHMIRGNSLDNVMTGNGSSDWFYGEGGDDTMIGGAGHDTYYVDSLGDVIIEGPDDFTPSGAYGDTVVTSLADYTLRPELELLEGDSSQQRLVGNDKANRLASRGGSDTLIGGKGDDEYSIQAGDIIVELEGEGTDIVYVNEGNYTLPDTLENLSGQASAGQILTGNRFANRVSGSGGNDIIDGAAGADAMEGGRGNDIYYVDQAGDSIKEYANEGTDEVRTALAVYTLGADVENFRGLSATGQTVHGNTLSNAMTGGEGDDVFRAEAGGTDALRRGGTDIVAGNGGNDLLVFGAGFTSADQANGGAGSDVLILQGSYNLTFTATSVQGIETISLLAYNDPTYGGAGTLALTYRLTTIDSTVAAGAAMTVDARSLSAGDSVNFNGAAETNGSFTLLGGAGSDILTGGALADSIDGGSGSDSMAGGKGDDVYFVSQAGDTVTEASSEGADEVRTGLASYTLGANVEKLTGLSATGQSLTGNGGANVITGASGNDSIDGGAGADTMLGGAGDDVYQVDSEGDSVVEQSGEGNDQVRTALAAYTLGANVERLAGLLATGQILTGNMAGNIIEGGAGDDVIDGRGGNDTLIGNGGADRLLVTVPGSVSVYGGAGLDTLAVDFSAATQGVVNPMAITGGANGWSGYYVAGDQFNVSFNDIERLEITTGAYNDHVATAGGDDRLILNGGDDSGRGYAGADHIDGGAGDDWISGGSGGDTLIGGEGSDFLEAAGNSSTFTRPVRGNEPAALPLLDTGTEVDVLSGGGGNDNISAGFGDSVDGGAGSDGLYISFQGAQAGVVADFRPLASGGSVVIGGATIGGIESVFWVEGSEYADFIAVPDRSGADDVIYGRGGDDTIVGGTATGNIYGGEGNDSIDSSASLYGGYLYGEAGDDLITDGDRSNNLYGGAGADRLYGGKGDDGLDGGGGDDLLDGGSGGDSMTGGAGDDIYFVDSTADSTIEAAGEGVDEVRTTLAAYALAAGLEKLTGLGSLDQALNGNGSDNVIDGGSGADSMAGLAGNDIYIVDDVGDTVAENAGEGTDEVRTHLAAFSLAALANVENLTGTGSAGQQLTGNGSANSITGASGNDIIDGGAGSDSLRGGLGDDVYFVDNAGDTVIENAGEGTDEIRTALASYSLAALPNVENLTGTSTTGQILTGNGLSNVIRSGSGGDRLRLDSGGDDMVFAGAGQDGVYFGAFLTSADQADGGADRDQLTIQGDYETVALTLGAGIVNFESFTLLSGTDTRYGDSGTHSYSYDITSRDENIAAGQLLVVDGAQLKAGEDFTFDGSAETDGAFRLWGGFGVEDLTGGALSDQFYFSFGRFGADDKVDGGASRDQLGLRGDYSIVFGAGQVTSIESMVLLSGRGVSDDTDYDYDLRMHDLNLAQGVRMTVDGGQLGAAEHLTFDGSAELDGTFRIFGGAGADSLTGGAGADMLLGAPGKDYLKGGGGADVYSYRGASDSTSTGYDTIDGFEFGSDTLVLPGVHDSYEALNGGALSSASLDSDLADAMASVLGSGEAVFFTAGDGDLAGHTFLIVDQNGIAGYQAGEDFVIEFVNSIVPAAIPDFIV